LRGFEVEIELTSGTPADLYPVVGARRGLVIAPDMMGRRKLFDDMAARLASAQNWNVIVVEMFRGRSFTTDTTDERHAVVGELDDDEVVGDLVDAANRLEVEPVALVGFCMGGMYAFKAAASHRFDRLASFYGMIRLPERWQGPGQREPLQLLQHAEDPTKILAIIGTEDRYTPPADVKALVETGVDVASYEGADHGFVHDPSRPAHNPDYAAEAWARFHAHLAL
jgi:carboxymethylenebutenolidase